MEHQEIKNPARKTKSVLIDAYNEAIAELKAKSNGNGATSTVAVAEAQRVANAIDIAGKVDVDAVVQALGIVGDSVKGAKEELDQINLAIKAKRQELHEVHGLVQETDSTVAIIAAKDKLVADRQERAEQILEDANQSAVEIKSDADEYADRVRSEIKEERERAELSRKRVQSEWDYDFGRKKQFQLDKLKDEVDAKNKELDIREDALVSRELSADDTQKKFDELLAIIKENDDVTEEKIARAVKEAKLSAEKSANIAKNLAEKEFEGRINVLTSEKAGLISQITDLSKRLERAERAVSSATDKVTDIATGALRAGADAQTVAKIGEIAAGSGGKGK